MLRLRQRRDTLPAFARLHMAGHWDADGTQMAAAIGQAVVRHGGAQPTLRRFPWWAIPLVSPVVPLARALREVRQLWSNPLRLRNTRLLEILGEEPHTPRTQPSRQHSRDQAACRHHCRHQRTD